MMMMTISVECKLWVCFTCVASILSCIRLEIRSNTLGSVRFQQLSLENHRQKEEGFKGLRYDSGRATYSSELDPPIYLYHIQLTDSVTSQLTRGRWVVSEELFSQDSAMAYADSWGVTPALMKSVPDVSTRWMIPSAAVLYGWEEDPSFDVICRDDGGDGTVYFESDPLLQPRLAGFYVQRYSTAYTGSTVSIDIEGSSPSSASYQSSPSSSSGRSVVYSQVRAAPHDEQLYLYQLPDAEPSVPSSWGWIVGDRYGVDAGVALIFTPDRAAFDDVKLIQAHDWLFIPPSEEQTWISGSATMYSGLTDFYDPTRSTGSLVTRNVYHTLLQARRLSSSGTPAQTMLVLRNGVLMPQMGLGTGGIYLEHSAEVFIEAYLSGYRLLDLAREYRNEHLVHEALLDDHGFRSSTAYRDHHQGSKQQIVIRKPPRRNELFLETKVWPTDLGFLPTSRAIETSLREVRSNYIDMYLLHWPSCNPSIEWMHCGSTVDSNGTWRESWYALEKAYVEGRVLSIGVSNFDRPLLEELHSIATTRPHLVQNWAEPGNVDQDVRDYCRVRNCVYQPYAPLRNVRFLSPTIRSVLDGLATKYQVSLYVIILRFFIQSGAAVIPRSTKKEHLEENLLAFEFRLEAEEMQSLGWSLSDPV